MSRDDFDRTPRRAEGSSKDGGEHLRESGKTAALKREILDLLALRGVDGVTVAEFLPSGSGKKPHHGQISSAFSTLHQGGYIERLTTRRSHYEVYVLPRYVAGRPTREHASVARMRREEALLSAVVRAEDALDNGTTTWRDTKALVEATEGLAAEVRKFLAKGGD